MLDWPRPFGARFHGFAVPAEDLLPQEPIRGKRAVQGYCERASGCRNGSVFLIFVLTIRGKRAVQGYCEQPRDVGTDPFS